MSDAEKIELAARVLDKYGHKITSKINDQIIKDLYRIADDLKQKENSASNSKTSNRNR